MKRFLLLFLALAVLTVGPAVSAEKKLTVAEAGQHVGETATVCGVVASGRYSERTRGRPTFLNLDKPYPDQVFTILIWGRIGRSSARPSNPCSTSGFAFRDRYGSTGEGRKSLHQSQDRLSSRSNPSVRLAPVGSALQQFAHIFN